MDEVLLEEEREIQSIRARAESLAPTTRRTTIELVKLLVRLTTGIPLSQQQRQQVWSLRRLHDCAGQDQPDVARLLAIIDRLDPTLARSR